MFEGDLVEGELEIGQASAMIKEVLPAAQIVENMMVDYRSTIEKLAGGL